MLNDELDSEATETFSFRMSKNLRERLRLTASNERRTVGREIVLRLIASFEGNAVENNTHVVASTVAKDALKKAKANELKIAELEERIARLETRS